jgi:serine/threonine-protein kinase
MQLAAGAIIGGKYQLDRPVSRGGMGSIWAGRHLQLGAPVAVKFMDPSYVASPAFRARFEREARAAANLKSPHVVAVQDYGIDGDVPYIVMELLQGEDLHTRLERRGRLTLAETAALLGQLGKALRRAHEIGLVHRDLKPRNVFLARSDDDEIAKILDFGIAKETGSKTVGDSTATGEIVGSPHFMSPEQLRADKGLDARSDLWSLGVILFRCLTGALPFPGEALTGVMVKILMDPIPRASEVAPDLPAALDGFFARAFARERDQRFQSVREMVDAFAEVPGATGAGARGSMGSLAALDPAASGPWPATPPAAGAHAGAVAVVAATAGPPAAMSTGSLRTTAVAAWGPARAQRVRAAWIVGAGVAVVASAVAALVALRGASPEATPAAAAGAPAGTAAGAPATAATPAAATGATPVNPAAVPQADAPEVGASGAPRAAPASSSKVGGKPPRSGATSAPASAKAPEANAPPDESWGF